VDTVRHKHIGSGGFEFDMSRLKGKRVGAFSPDLIRQYTDWYLEQRLGKCDVYWGRHACNRPRGHDNDGEPYPTHAHECKCGNHPEPFSVVWGRDISDAEQEDLQYCREELAWHEAQLSRYDEFDKFGNYRGPTIPARGNKNGSKSNSRHVEIGGVSGSIVTGYSD